MLRSGILNPQINVLLARFRHTNRIVIADRGFPFWPLIETVDISLVDGLPAVRDVLKAVEASCVIGRAWMAEEFLRENGPKADASYRDILKGVGIHFESHEGFKKRVPETIGLIRTGDTMPYANIILESA